MTPTNTTELTDSVKLALSYAAPSDTKELLDLGPYLMTIDPDYLTEDDEDDLLVYSDMMMAFAKSAHQEGGHCAAMNSAVDAYNALRWVMGLHDHVSTIVLTAD
jgi:hypothetical protein